MASDTLNEIAEVAEVAKAPGMPQLDFSTFPNQIFWLVVAMVVTFFIVSKVILPRIGGVLEERHAVISNYLVQAADFKKQAETAEAEYETALKEARAEAQAIAAETKANILKDLDKSVALADAEIAAKTAESEKAIADIRESAVDDVRDVATTAASDILSALMPSVSDKAAVKKAVTARIKG
ncbi:MAG: F0F1 ATP synthase subunit B' [Rhodobacteraceae bacterium]|nr:F0F1 ATP synthase subunit B' [Paracoccaceae bacterium]